MRHRSGLLFAASLALVTLAGCGRDVEDLRPVLDLVAALPEAETYREVDTIEIGTPLAAEQLLWGWSWNEREPAADGGETTYAWGLGGSSGLRFYLAARRDLHLELRGRPGPTPPDAPQMVTVEVNGETLERLRLRPREAGWVAYSVSVPREVLTTGWNTLVLEYRHAIEPRETGLSGDRRPLAVAWDRVRIDPAPPLEETGPEAAGEVLHLPLGSEVAYHAPLPAGSVLVLDRIRTTGVESRLLVSLQWEGEDPVDLVSLERSKRRRVLDLPPGHAAPGDGEPRLARLTLRAAPAGWLKAHEATADGAIEVVAPRVMAPAPDPERAARPAFAHLDYDGRVGVSVVLGEWKLIEPLTLRFGRGPQLYHLGRDPEERENLAESHPVRTGYLRALVRRHLLEAGDGGAAGAGERVELDPE